MVIPQERRDGSEIPEELANCAKARRRWARVHTTESHSQLSRVVGEQRERKGGAVGMGWGMGGARCGFIHNQATLVGRWGA